MRVEGGTLEQGVVVTVVVVVTLQLFVARLGALMSMHLQAAALLQKLF